MKNFLLSLSFFLASLSFVEAQTFIKGVDLSLVNRLEDCGIEYYQNNVKKDVFTIFKNKGANLVRARLWFGDNPQPGSGYSTIADVLKTFNRAKAKGMQTELSIHYSDNWTHPGQQKAPQEWSNVAKLSTGWSTLANYVYGYTQYVIDEIGKSKIDYIQIGNETMGGIACPTNNWGCNGLSDWDRYERMKYMLQSGINAAANKGFAENKILVHIAGPRNSDWWLDRMVNQHGLTGFGTVGLSYYPTLNGDWGHDISIAEVGRIIRRVRAAYNKDVMIVETSHPFTTAYANDRNNRTDLVTDNENFGSTPTAWIQKEFLIRLSKEVIKSGGNGVIYWEPAWVSDGDACPKDYSFSPALGGSDQENQTFFKVNGNHNLVNNGGVKYLGFSYNALANFRQVTFRVYISGSTNNPQMAIDSDFDGNYETIPLQYGSGDVYWATTSLEKGKSYNYKFLRNTNWSSQENLSCNGANNRKITIPNSNLTVGADFGNCTNWQWQTYRQDLGVELVENEQSDTALKIYPNPVESGSNAIINVEHSNDLNISDLQLTNLAGQLVDAVFYDSSSQSKEIVIESLATGIYLLRYKVNGLWKVKKLSVR